MVGIETPLKDGVFASEQGTAPVKQQEMQDELDHVRRQLQQERQANEELKMDRDRWLIEMESTLQDSRGALERVHTRNLELQSAQSEELQPPCAPPAPPTRGYQPLTSPGSPPLPRSPVKQPISQGGMTPPATRPTRAHRTIMSPGAPGFGLTHHHHTSEARQVGAGGGDVAHPHHHHSHTGAESVNGGSSGGTTTSSVAKAAWAKFVRLASDKFTPTELVLVSLETLKALMKHYQLRDPIECARIEVYWRLLAIHREGGSAASNADTSEHPPGGQQLPLSPSGAPGGARRRQQQQQLLQQQGYQAGGSRFTPVEHPRPFHVHAPVRGAHLSRRSSLKGESPRCCDPNRSEGAQYRWVTAQGQGSTERMSIRTYTRSLSEGARGGGRRRSVSQPTAYRPSGCPTDVPSSFHPPVQRGLRTFVGSPVAGGETTPQEKPSGRRAGSAGPKDRRAGQAAESPVPPVRSLRVLRDSGALGEEAVRNEGLRVSAEWGAGSLGASGAFVREAPGEVRCRRHGYSAQAGSDPLASPRSPRAAQGGLRMPSKKLAAASDPNPNPRDRAALAISDKRGERAAGLRVHDGAWGRTHHDDSQAIPAEEQAAVRLERVVPPEHVSTTRRLHSFGDFHGGSPASQARGAAGPSPAASAAATGGVAGSGPPTQQQQQQHAAPVREEVIPSAAQQQPQASGGQGAPGGTGKHSPEAPPEPSASNAGGTPATPSLAPPQPCSAAGKAVLHSRGAAQHSAAAEALASAAQPGLQDQSLLDLSAEDFERVERECGTSGRAAQQPSHSAGLPSYRSEAAQLTKPYRDIRKHDGPKRKVTVHSQVPRCAEVRTYRASAPKTAPLRANVAAR